MAKRIQVGGRIESKEVGGIVTGAAEILDDAKEKKQSVINQETDDELVRLDQSKQDNLTFDNAPTEGSDNPVKSGGVYAADKALSDAIEAILLLIPSAASTLNKLVDTATMNSSISTATATFRGTYNVVTDLSLTVDATHEQIAAALGNTISTADNNDYAFVQIPVSAESTDIRRTERYKFNGTGWGYEYDLNTSGFTAAQWAALNSGITIALVGKLIGLPTSSELQALLGQKQDTLTFDNIPVSGSTNPVKSGGVYSAINDEKTAREQLAQKVTGIDGRVGNVEEVIPTGAAANNKLVANNSMEAYVTNIIEAITASFTIATADGHISLTLTQTNGRVASLTLTTSDIASAQALTALTGRVSTAEGNITTLGGRVSTNETDIANLQQLYNNLQQSKPVPVTALPETGQQQGVIYRLAGTTSYSDYMWNGSTWVLMATYNNAIDPRPKKASQNLVTSGGVFDNIGALDVSELNATENPHTLAQYVDLSAALAAIPTDYQKGGMSIKFVQSSDNKYVQYRLMVTSFSTTEADWQGIDDEPTAGSDNLVKSGGVYTAIQPDETLSILGKAADAKVTGDIRRDFNTLALANVNLFDKDNATTGKYLSDGVEADNPNLFYTDFIPAKPNEKFITLYGANSGLSPLQEYNSEKTYIGEVYGVKVGDYIVYTCGSLSSISYIRINNTLNIINTLMIVKGEVYPNFYVPYKSARLYPEIPFSEKQQNDLDVEIMKIATQTPNYFDKDTIQMVNGYFSNGVFYSDSNYRMTNPIKVKNGTAYCYPQSSSLGANTNVAKLNGDLEFTGGFINGTLSNGIVTFVADADVYVRINIGKTTEVNRFFLIEETDYKGKYEPYGNELNKNVFPNGKMLTPNLYNKRVVFDGDSICYGAGDTIGRGYASRIGNANDMVWANVGVSGGTIAVISGVSHNLCTYIDTIHTNYPTLDYLILEGGTNDADRLQMEGIGTLTALNDFSGDYDTSTFYGALETLFYKAISYYPSAKIGFVVAMKMGIWQHDVYYLPERRRAFFDAAITTCKKWGVPYIDLWNGCPMNSGLEAYFDRTMTAEQNLAAGKMYADHQHPNANGYDYMWSTIASWMNKL